MTNVRYWRLEVEATGGGSPASIAELEFHGTVGGAQLLTGGTPSADSVTGADDPANVLDGNASTFWANSNFLSQAAAEAWWQYDFGVGGGISAVAEIKIKARSSFVTQTPVRTRIAWSTDGSNFYGYGRVANAATWSASQVQTLAVTPYAGYNGTDTHNRWRLLFDGNAGNSGNVVALAEAEFHSTPGGADVFPSFSASSEFSGDPATNAGDGDPSTFWATASGGGKPGSWLREDFAGPVAIQEVVLTARNDTNFNQAPGSVHLQYSTDSGITWIDAAVWENLSFSAGGGVTLNVANAQFGGGGGGGGSPLWVPPRRRGLVLIDRTIWR